jgi:DNA-directed RNA polymerase subunit RPC12/RpoP
MGKVFCKWCGMSFSDVRNLVNNACPRNPWGQAGSKHELYEGSEKPKYVCKYCGQTFRTIGDMSATRTCGRNPAGNKRHEPAL